MIIALDLIGDLGKAFEDFAQVMVAGVPVLFKAIILFGIGYFVAKVCSVVVSKGLKKLNFDDLAVKLKLDEPIRIAGIKGGLSQLIGSIVFGLLMLVVIVTVTDNLGIEVLTKQVNRIIDFIPNFFSAILILLAGYFIATKIKDVLVNLNRSLGGNAGSVLGNILYYFIMVMVVITAIEQMGIDTDLISKNILIIVGVLLLAGAVAYGHAARDIMKNMLSSFYSKKNFREGQEIKLKEIQGTILEIDNTSVTLSVSGKKVIIPSSELLSNYVEIIEDVQA